VSNYEADVELGKAQAKINALKARAERSEASAAHLFAQLADEQQQRMEAERGFDALKADLTRAVEERDAALVLYKASALSWCQRVPQVPVREAVAARELLHERGLLVGERG